MWMCVGVYSCFIPFYNRSSKFGICPLLTFPKTWRFDASKTLVRDVRLTQISHECFGLILDNVGLFDKLFDTNIRFNLITFLKLQCST